MSEKGEFKKMVREKVLCGIWDCDWSEVKLLKYWRIECVWGKEFWCRERWQGSFQDG